jgi:LPS export ABC transporter protein LptC
MKRSSYKIAATLGVVAIFLLGACTNNPDDIKKVAAVEELKPLNVQYNIVYDYSDSAKTRLLLKAPEVKDFSHAEENPYYEFPQGIDVTFFDKFGKEESHLKANYAKQWITEDKWEARGDVVVNNKKGEQLNTEHLIWDVKEELISSDVFVKITTGDEVIMGEGFEADQSFTSYKLKGNVKGELKLEEPEEDENAEDS